MNFSWEEKGGIVVLNLTKKEPINTTTDNQLPRFIQHKISQGFIPKKTLESVDSRSPLQFNFNSQHPAVLVKHKVTLFFRISGRYSLQETGPRCRTDTLKKHFFTSTECRTIIITDESKLMSPSDDSYCISYTLFICAYSVFITIKCFQ